MVAAVVYQQYSRGSNKGITRVHVVGSPRGTLTVESSSQAAQIRRGCARGERMPPRAGGHVILLPVTREIARRLCGDNTSQ